MKRSRLFKVTLCLANIFYQLLDAWWRIVVAHSASAFIPCRHRRRTVRLTVPSSNHREIASTPVLQYSACLYVWRVPQCSISLSENACGQHIGRLRNHSAILLASKQLLLQGQHSFRSRADHVMSTSISLSEMASGQPIDGAEGCAVCTHSRTTQQYRFSNFCSRSRIHSDQRSLIGASPGR